MPVTPPTPAMVPGRVLLIDGDYAAYYCAGNADTSPGVARTAARERFISMKEMSGAEKMVVHLTDNGSHKGHRFVIASELPYQGNRGGSAKPKNWEFLRDWMQTGADGLFKVKTWGDREADDGAAYHAMTLGPEVTVMSVADKDWRMIPGWHLDWKTWQLTYCAPNTWRLDGADGHIHGESFFWYQLLCGDSADHIPGLPRVHIQGKAKKIGPVTAQQYIDRVDNHWDAFLLVGAMYRTHYGENWADRLAEQMALLWMRRGKNAEIDDCLQWIDPRITQYMQPAFDRLAARVRAAYQQVAI